MSTLLQSFLGCQVCEALWDAFVAYPDGHSLTRFDHEDLASCSQCHKHTPLFDFLKQSWIRQWSLSKEDGEKPSWWNKEFAGIAVFSDSRSSAGDPESSPFVDVEVSIETENELIGFIQDFYLLHRDAVEGHPGIRRNLDPHWADLSCARRCKQECLDSHSACRNPLNAPEARPMWLVDARSQCVVPGTGHDSFIALSYRWGDTSPIICDSSMMQKLRSQGSLQTPAIKALIPSIVPHALGLTLALDERYIWIDALCIDHSDKENTKAQIERMGSIYANAVVTIVAANTDAKGGIPGLRSISYSRKHRHLSQTGINWGDEKIMVASEAFQEREFLGPPRPEVYFTRGWTLQEYVLSQRRLIIDDTGLHWECRSCTWHEELEAYTGLRGSVQLGAGNLLTGLGDFYRLETQLLEYSRRNLTHDDDALAGVSGLLRLASRSISGGFMYGLVVQCFDDALCWLSNSGNLRRRKRSVRSEQELPVDHALPSWSWIGWQGRFHSLGAPDLKLTSKVTETMPITEWYAGKHPWTLQADRQRIKNTWYESRTEYKNSGVPFPHGWTRHSVLELSEAKRSDIAFPEDCADCFFRHTTMSDHSFYYPFPIPHVDESTPAADVEQLPYLFCNTQKTRLWARLPAKGPGEWTVDPSLFTESGSKVGELWPDGDAEQQMLEQYAQSPPGLEICAVAICKQHRYYRRAADSGTFEETRVLWVEEIDGVSYRKGIGKIWQGGWEKLERQEVALVLG